MAMERIVRTDSPSPAVWEPCAACWGQGRIYCRGEEGRLQAVACYGCLGVGQTLRLPEGPGVSPDRT